METYILPNSDKIWVLNDDGETLTISVDDITWSIGSVEKVTQTNDEGNIWRLNGNS